MDPWQRCSHLGPGRAHIGIADHPVGVGIVADIGCIDRRSQLRFDRGDIGVAFRGSPSADGATSYQPGTTPQDGRTKTFTSAESAIHLHSFLGRAELNERLLIRAFSVCLLFAHSLGRCPRLATASPSDGGLL